LLAVQVSDDEITHEMIATTIWGGPTTVSAERLPSIPIIHIKKSDGDRLRAAATAGVKVHLTTKVGQGWAGFDRRPLAPKTGDTSRLSLRLSL
jgi:hypothetical protein